MKRKYCILGCEYNDLHKSEFFEEVKNEILTTTDDWEKAHYFKDIELAECTLRMLKSDFNDYGWYLVIVEGE